MTLVICIKPNFVYPRFHLGRNHARLRRMLDPFEGSPSASPFSFSIASTALANIMIDPEGEWSVSSASCSYLQGRSGTPESITSDFGIMTLIERPMP